MNSKQENLLSDGRILVSDILARSKHAKQQICGDQPMTDAPPMAFIAIKCDPKNDNYREMREHSSMLGLSDTYEVGFAPLITGDDPVESTKHLLDALAGNIKFEFLFVVVEGYGREVGSLPENYERGTLEDDFRNNPFSDVREGIIITGIDWGATRLFYSQNFYRYDDRGVPVFDAEIYDSSPAPSHEDIRDKSDELGRMNIVLTRGAIRSQVAWEFQDYADLLRKNNDN